MTRDEIVTALRCCSAPGDCNKCPADRIERCVTLVLSAAADLIENQQRHIEALMKANDSLKDAVVRKEQELVKYRAGDVAPIIRCRDCQFYREGEKLAPMKFCYRMGRLNRGPDDYCSRAERRSDAAVNRRIEAELLRWARFAVDNHKEADDADQR